jgi:FHA domain
MTHRPSYPIFAMDQSNDQDLEPDTHELELSDDIIEASARQTDPLDLDIPRRLRFVVMDTNEVFEVNVRLYMVIGRKTNPRDRKVDIDLTPFVKRNHGVSRYHSYIQVVDNRISITDFNSTNGTYINGKSLQPSRAYRLRHGDNIRLGNLEFKILFIGIDDTD